MTFTKGASRAALVRATSAAALAIAASLAAAAPAGATITKTHITTPSASPSYFTYNENKPSNSKANTFTVSGTTDSTSPTTDTVDIDCFFGDAGRYVTVYNGVTLNTDGSFSVSTSFNPVMGLECRLAALPSGQSSLESSYAGPWVDVSEKQSDPISGGPEDGKLFDYAAEGEQPALVDTYNSIGSCGLCNSYLQDTTGAVTSDVFYANAWLNYGNTNETADTRSEIKVDGRDAYLPGAAVGPPLFNGIDQEPGFPTLRWRFSQNPSNGNVTIAETDQIARCSGSPSYPPNSTTCPSFKSTGVEVKREIVQSASGHVVSITDNYKSTDGRTHKLDLLYENNQCLTINTCAPSRIGYRFPGEHAYHSHAPANVVHVPSGIGSIYVNVLGAPDGDPYTGQGAITYGKAPTEVLFNPIPSFGSSSFTMHYRGKVPAKGALTYRFVYSTAYTYAQVHRYALAAQKALK